MRYSVALLAAVATLFAGTAHAGWIHESPATANDQGAYASIALDASDMSYAAWYDVTNARVRYGKRPLSGWQISSLDTAGKGEFASLKIMPLSFWPAIAYYDAAGEARYASFGPSIWQYQWVNAVAGGDEGRWTDLAFDSSGTPWLSYHFDEGASGDLGLLVCNKAGPTWDCTEVETRPSATAAAGELLGTHTAIVIDSAENPWVTYRDELDGRQKIAWRDAGTWQVEYVSADGDSAGSYPGIAIDDNDFIYISHWDDGEAGGNCASVVSNETGDWVKDSFDCFASDDYGKYTGIALGADGSLHVSYYGDPGLRYARKAPAGTWETQTPDNTGDPGLWTSIALAAKDAPHIVHYEAGAGDFRYTWWLGDPVIDSIDPPSAENTDDQVSIAVTGAAFTADSTIGLYYPDRDVTVPASSAAIFSARNIGFDVDLVGAWPGLYDVVVTNTESSGVLEEGFLVTSPPPDITATDPFGGPNDALLYNVDIEGNYFADGMTVKLIPPTGPAINANQVTIASTSDATARFNLLNKAPGDYDVEVTTDFGTDKLDDYFAVYCAEPVADFTADPVTGDAPLTVQFTDTSTDYNGCRVQLWSWNFGDAGTSHDPSPTHVYTHSGTYDVTLTVQSLGGQVMKRKRNFINVTGAPDDDDADDDADDDVDDDADDDVDDDASDDDDFNPPGSHDDDADDDDEDIITPDDDEPAGRGGDDDDDSGTCGK